MSKKTLMGTIIVVIAAIVGTSLYWFWQQQPEKYTGPVEKITFGSSATHKIAGVFVAQNQGYFEESGIDLEIKEFDSGKASFQAMLEGEGVDISATADTPLVFESFDRDDFYVLAGIYTSYDDKVIARRDKGINSVANLRGKRVGVTLGTSAHFLLSSLLTHNGILASEVELVNLKPADLVLMDVQLPDIDGLETTKIIRASEAAGEVPIVALTSFAMAGDKEKALAAGCTGYIKKPINPETFMAEIKKYL